MATETERSSKTPRFGSDYEVYFDPKVYLNKSYTAEGPYNRLYRVLLQELHTLVAERNIPEGSRLLDVGAGPSIASVISAGARCKEVVCAEYCDANREELKRWLKAEEGAFDWRPIIEYICQLEGSGENWEKRQRHLKEVIKQVVPCDVNLPNPLAPLKLGQFDVIISTLAVDAACKDRESFKNAIKHIVSLLKPGGFLFLSGVSGCTFYMVGEEMFSTIPIDPEFIEHAVTDAGLVDIRSMTKGEEHHQGESDFNSMFCVSASKK